MTATATDQIRSLIKEDLPNLVAFRKDLHAHPEIGFEEHRTAEQVRGELEKMKMKFVGGMAGGTGTLAHLPGESDKTIGLRADMDALPMEELSDIPHRSTNPGFMHACGHDGHTTILLGTARVLAKLSQNSPLPNPVTFVFQPAEEGFGGGRKMVEDGCLDGSKIGEPITTMFGLHGWPQMSLGDVGTRPGPFLAAADNFKITITGHGGHAAFPHLGHDPIIAATAIVSALQSIASRNISPLESVVVSVTTIHGGSANNVIPDEVTMTGTVRSLLPEVQELTKARIETVVKDMSKAYGCKGSFEYNYGYPVTLNDTNAVETFEQTARETLGANHVVRLPQPVMGAEDFSYYCQKVPSCFFTLGLLPEGQERMPQLHEATFDFNDDAIATGIETFCHLALQT